MAALEVGNTTYVKQNMTDLIQVNQSIYDICADLKESCDKIKASWRSTGTTDNVNYITKLYENIEKVDKLVNVVSSLAEYVNQYIDDSSAIANNTGASSNTVVKPSSMSANAAVR